MLSSKRLVIGAVILYLFASYAAAQEFRGSISGRVTEASGGVVAGAQITITNTATNTTTSTTANESGDFSVLYLNPGSAGPRRFTLPIALATLELTDDGLRPCILDLGGYGARR